MEVKTFDFKFNHEGENIKAYCQVSRPLMKEQFRISLMEENKDPLILVMYKVDRKDEMFFWFFAGEKREALSSSIARTLERIL